MQKIKTFLKMNLKDKKYSLFNFFVRKYMNKLQKKMNFKGRYSFIDRSRKNKELLIIVAGYKDYLWDNVFRRIELFCPKNIDVCIVVPGKEDIRLKNFAKENNWSYLSTKENKLSLAQNLAIINHPKAELIYKLDEDIFIGKNYFTNMRECYEFIKKEKKYEINFISPVLNVNGISYEIFLKKLSLKEEYFKKFGEIKVSTMKCKAWHDPEAAKYLWKKSLPIEKVEKIFEKDSDIYCIIPFRFSIGAILIERSWWEEIEGFNSSYEGCLGVEEEQMIIEGVKKERAAFISLRTFAGHFSFGPQNEKMKEFYIKNKKMFEI